MYIYAHLHICMRTIQLVMGMLSELLPAKGEISCSVFPGIAISPHTQETGL